MLSANRFNLDQYKILSSGNGLNDLIKKKKVFPSFEKHFNCPFEIPQVWTGLKFNCVVTGLFMFGSYSFRQVHLQ